ncbi:hypothetical protein LMG9964_02187 [Paraburkholderia phenoliruptrix]|uniref:Uncharacterized protein n=2 Tax=Paraburkholderia phenoliruptrix TaxID=252970 RepID=A0A6J5K439_9BURK|nr:hypothetical protein LMG9964_02187 [Paraburkholderia phenoliruptrix]
MSSRIYRKALSGSNVLAFTGFILTFRAAKCLSPWVGYSCDIANFNLPRMSRLGIERESGLIYEGRDNASYLILPPPVLSQCVLVQSPADLDRLPANIDSVPFSWIFREDSFDSVSRVRRGRVFQKQGNSNAEPCVVNAHPHVVTDIASGRNDGRVAKQLNLFMECQELLSQADRGEGLQLAIGVASAYSLWRILQVERTVAQDVMVTLRAESSMGILPELDQTQIHPESIQAVRVAIKRVLDAAYREIPTSVVDQCRNACATMASHWLYRKSGEDRVLEKDLGKVIAAIQQRVGFDESRTLCSALDIVNRLHPRGKHNEVHRLGLRDVTEEDAALAVHATGFVIREFGWARR